MSKKKKVSPLQLQILTVGEGGTLPYYPSGWSDVGTAPNPFLPEEGDIILPDGEGVFTDGADIILPDADADEAYY